MRYKTLPVHPKWLNLARFARTGRVLYRFGQHNTEQGEFCTVLTTKKPSRESFVPNARQRSSEPRQYSGATGAKRKAPKEPQDLAAVQAAAGWQGQHRFAGASARLISHIISHGHFSRPPKNVAIPTMQIQYLNKLQGNCMRNCSDGWSGLVLWTGCFEGCWLLLVVLCPLARVLVG